MSPENELEAEKKEITVISDRKLKANRENAQKSTGPKTSKGKANSRFNAERHGLTSKLLFGADGKPLNNGLQQLSDDLHDRYGRGDAHTEQLIENILLRRWRQYRGCEAEMAHFARPSHVSSPDIPFHPGGCLALILRYNDSNERAVTRNYTLLNKLHPEAPEAADPDDSGEEDLPVFAGGETESEPEGRLPAQSAADRASSIENDCSATDQDAELGPEGQPPAPILMPTNRQPTPTHPEEIEEPNTAQQNPARCEGLLHRIEHVG
jgi:hypothetical protein